jgi:hypothetical protein
MNRIAYRPQACAPHPGGKLGLCALQANLAGYVFDPISPAFFNRDIGSRPCLKLRFVIDFGNDLLGDSASLFRVQLGIKPAENKNA